MRSAVLILLAALPGAALQAQAPRDHISRAVQAMGGEPALRALRTVQADYHVATFGLGQSETAESPPRAGLAIGRVVTDVQGMRRSRAVEVRPVAGNPARSRRVTAGGIGSFQNVDGGTLVFDPVPTVMAIERAMRRDPERLLITALDNEGALSALPSRSFRGEPADGVRFALGADTLELYFDRYTGLPVAYQTLTDDPILGDRRTTALLSRWQKAGNVMFARQVDVTVNDQQLEHWILTAVATDVPVADSVFAIPDSIASRAPRIAGFTPQPVSVPLVELAPGVWRAEGSTHHTLIVDQPDGLLLIEAPQSAARMQAVLDTIRSRFPSRRISQVVNTHHHWDHSSGLRTVIGAGIPVVTHERNAAFIRRIAAARKTVLPDEQSRRRRPPQVRTMRDSLVIGSGTSQVVVYAIPSVHAEGIVAAWVPSAQVVFTSDVLNPAPTLSPSGSAELVAFARSRGIAPARYAGGHGAVLDWAAVERAASAR